MFPFSSAGYFKLFDAILQSSSPSVHTEGVTLAYVQWKPTTYGYSYEKYPSQALSVPLQH